MLVNIVGTVASCRNALGMIGWDTTFPHVDGDDIVFPVFKKYRQDGQLVSRAAARETVLIPVPRSVPPGNARAAFLVKAIRVRELLTQC